MDIKCRNEIPGFEKLAEKVERSASRREEIRCYRDAAIERVLNSPDPWKMEFSRNRQGNFSPEADTFLVICVGTEGRIDCRLPCMDGISGLAFAAL